MGKCCRILLIWVFLIHLTLLGFAKTELESVLEKGGTKLVEPGVYKGLIVFIPKKDTRSLEMRRTQYKKYNKNLALLPELNDFKVELDRRIVEIELEYKKHKQSPEGYKGNDYKYEWEKNPLPSCIKNGLNRYLEDLKSGDRKLYIIWSRETISWKTIKEHSFVNWHGQCIAPGHIEIYDAYQEKILEKKVASLLFHELVHAVTYKDTKCCQSIKNGKSQADEEASAEDAQIKVFGRKYTRTPYERTSYTDNPEDVWNKKGDDCTYEKVCFCKEGCPGDSSSSTTNRMSMSSDNNAADFCTPPPPEDPGPGADNPDDNESMSSGITRIYNLAPRSLVLKRGYWQEAAKLFGGLLFDGNNSAEELIQVSKVLVIPTAALSQVYGDSSG